MTRGDDATVAGTAPESAENAIASADLVGGRYRIVRWLGGGGMGRVYEALDTELDVRVALKVLHLSTSDEALERFAGELIQAVSPRKSGAAPRFSRVTLDGSVGEIGAGSCPAVPADALG